jgi:Hint domain
VSGTAGATASLVVSGAGALLSESGAVFPQTGALIVGDTGAGVLSAINGGTVLADNLNMGSSGIIAQISVDAASKVVIGTAGTGAAGAITVDAFNVFADGVMSANLVNNGDIFANGTLEVTGSVDGNGQIFINNGGTATVGGTIVTTPGAVLQLDSAVAAGTNITFVSAPNAATAPVMRLLDPGDFEGTIWTFTGDGDTLDLVGETITNATIEPSDFPSNSTLVVTLASGGPLDFDLSATPASTDVTFSGSDITVVAPCFVVGTRIGTLRGEIAVEDLALRDRVVTASGELRPVVWIGRRSVDCARHPTPQKVWPVRISAGAFADNQPRRDLWLSPDHAVFVDDVLIPIRYLINETTIVQVPVDTVDYYHVELPRHDVLLAEGLPAESYLDTGDRRNFANGGAAIALYPDFASRVWDAQGCAPLVVTGPRLEAVRRRVSALASSLTPAPASRSPRRPRRRYPRR